MRSLFTFLLLVVFSTVAFAQFQIGFRAGYGFSDLRADSELDLVADQFENASSLSTGLYLEYAFSEVFSLRSGLELNRRGTTLNLSDDLEVFGASLPFGASAKTRFSYVDVPLQLQLHLPTEGIIKPYVFGGASFGLATGGNIRTTAKAIIEFNLMTTSIDLDAINYERFHVAAVGGLGARAQLAPNFSAFVEGRFEQSLTEPYDVPVIAAKTGFKGLNFGAGVAFAL